MHECLGYFWPDVPALDGMHAAYLNSADDMRLAMSHVAKFDVAVQAGGHCGEWALWLAKKFGKVYTFEPDEENFSCLVHNVAGHENILIVRGFLGADHGSIALRREQYSLGGSHHGVPSSAGTIPVYRIDDLNLPACDALILDIEGMEPAAIKGALETIKKYSPVIQIENYDEYAKYGWGCLKDIQAMLPDYKEVGRVNYDIVMVRK